MSPKILDLSKNEKQELFRENLLKVLGITFLIAVAAGLTYLSITCNSKCFIALGFWILTATVWFIPLPSEIGLNPLISSVCLAISVIITFKCFQGNIEAWLINCWDIIILFFK